MPNNDLQIQDIKVSGMHCRILRKIDEEGKMVVVLEDRSSNGTYHNGDKVSIYTEGLYYPIKENLSSILTGMLRSEKEASEN